MREADIMSSESHQGRQVDWKGFPKMAG